MRQIKVLVAGSGNTTGINVIKSLHEDVNVIGCDFNEINPANKFCKNFVVPRCASSEYGCAILNLIEREEVTHIIASNDHDVRALTHLSPNLTRIGVTFNGCRGTVTLDCLDKEKTYRLFVENGICTPLEFPVSEIQNHLPCVIRIKDMGRTRKFVDIVHDEDELRAVPQSHLENGICTEFVEGEEYTVDYLCDDKSNLIIAIPRLRVVVSNGMVWHGKVVNNESLITEVAHVVKRIGLVGIGCVQCIKDGPGKYQFIEINPRPGSGIDLSINSGANLPLLWLRLQQGMEISKPTINWRTQMIRYNTAYYFEE